MNKETVEKMGQLRLYGMQTAFKSFIEIPPPKAFTNDELAEYLITSEWDDRKHRSVQRGIKTAKFRYVADIANLDYNPNRGLDKNQLNRLIAGDFIKAAQDVFITGSTGTGKSCFSHRLSSLFTRLQSLLCKYSKVTVCFKNG